MLWPQQQRGDSSPPFCWAPFVTSISQPPSGSVQRYFSPVFMAMTVTPFSNRRQTTIHGIPVDVGEKRLHVFSLLGRLIIEKVSVLPDIHHQNGLESRHVSHLVERDPMVR